MPAAFAVRWALLPVVLCAVGVGGEGDVTPPPVPLRAMADDSGAGASFLDPPSYGTDTYSYTDENAETPPAEFPSLAVPMVGALEDVVPAAGACGACYLLQIAMGTSALIPLHGFVMLQVLYLTSRMDVATEAARDILRVLKPCVRPSVIDVSDDPSTNHLAFAMVLHFSLVVGHLCAVAVAYSVAKTPRNWQRAAAATLFPNATLHISQCFVVPLLAGVINAEFGVWMMVGGVYLTILTSVIVSVMIWVHTSRLSTTPPHAEFIEVDTAALTAESVPAIPPQGVCPGGDGRVVDVESRLCCAPVWSDKLQRHAGAWFPSGFWSSHHLIEREFMRKYSTFLAEYAPGGIRWYPAAAFARLFVLTALAREGPAGSAVRHGCVVAVTVIYFGVVAWRRPCNCAGSNLALAALYAAFAAALGAAGWGGRAAVTAFCVILVAVITLATLWFTLSWLVTRRLISQHLGLQQRVFAPAERAKVSASGFVHISIDSAAASAVPVAKPGSAGAGGILHTESIDVESATAERDSTSCMGVGTDSPSPSAQSDRCVISVVCDADAAEQATLGGTAVEQHRWCELRGAVLEVYAAKGDTIPERCVEVDLAAAVFFPQPRARHSALTPDPSDPASAGPSGVRLLGTGAHADEHVQIHFDDAGTMVMWQRAIDAATHVHTACPAGTRTMCEITNSPCVAHGVFGGHAMRIPKADRLHNYRFFEEEQPIQTTHGEYRHCAVNPRSAGGIWRAASAVPNTAYSEPSSEADETEEHLLMHGVRKEVLTAQQVTAWSSELAILVQLRHARLLRVTAAFETPTAMFWTVPYCAMGSLGEYLAAHGAMDESAVARHTAEILAGLDHLHAHGLVFRNLSTSDVVFNDMGRIALSDPGLPGVKIIPSKVRFTAPEVLDGEDPTPAADLWALGCIAYEMLHVTPAFNGTDRGQTTKLIRNTKPTVHKRFSKACADAVARLLTTAPDSRGDVVSMKGGPWFAEQGVVWEEGCDGMWDAPFMTCHVENVSISSMSRQSESSSRPASQVSGGLMETMPNPLVAMFGDAAPSFSRQSSHSSTSFPRRSRAVSSPLPYGLRALSFTRASRGQRSTESLHSDNSTPQSVMRVQSHLTAVSPGLASAPRTPRSPGVQPNPRPARSPQSDKYLTQKRESNAAVHGAMLRVA